MYQQFMNSILSMDYIQQNITGPATFFPEELCSICRMPAWVVKCALVKLCQGLARAFVRLWP